MGYSFDLVCTHCFMHLLFYIGVVSVFSIVTQVVSSAKIKGANVCYCGRESNDRKYCHILRHILSKYALFTYTVVMCGRYSLAVLLALLAERFGLYDIEAAILLNLIPRYNLAPSQIAPIITGGEQRKLEPMRWGLVPSWAKDESFGAKMINARAETLAEKPSFRKLIDRSRILVPADGFFEWRDLPNRTRGPVRIMLQGGEPFAFAGLADTWKKPDGSELKTFTIITTEANQLLKPIHDRMPVILPRNAEADWLDRTKTGKDIQSLLKSYPSEAMDIYPVSRIVNSPFNDSPECIEPVTESV